MTRSPFEGRLHRVAFGRCVQMWQTFEQCTDEAATMDLTAEQATKYLDKLNQLYLAAHSYEAYLDPNSGRIFYRK